MYSSGGSPGDLGEAALEGAFRQAAQGGHRRDRRVLVVVHAAHSWHFAITASSTGRAGERGERLLADGMPVDEIDLRDVHRDIDADEARDQIKRDALPARPAARHDEAVAFAAHDERALGLHLHGRIAAPQDVAVRPVRGGLVAIQQSGLGEQHGARAGGGERRPGRVAALQPGDLLGEASRQRVARRNRQLRHAHDVGRGTLGNRCLRRNPHAVGCLERLGPAGHDQRVQQRWAGFPVDDRLPVAASGHEQVIHAVDHGGRGLGEGEDGDGRRSGCLGHGRFVRFVAETALVQQRLHG